MESRDAFYLLIELSSTNGQINLNDVLELSLEKAFESKLISDAVVAQTEEQRIQTWKIREELPEGTLREGLQLKHDISVPISQFPSFLETCSKNVHSILPGVRIWQFGHLGDGNIHYNISPPIGETNFQNLELEINRAVYKTADSYGGSFAAEHGMGKTKINIANELRSKTERDLMKKIQHAIDPEDIMNPGVVV